MMETWPISVNAYSTLFAVHPVSDECISFFIKKYVGLK